MDKEYKKSLDNMEDISLEDADRTSVEYRLLMVYAQRRLSASKYGQLLERETKAQEESRESAQAVTPAKEEVTLQEICLAGDKPLAQYKEQKKVKKKKAKKMKTRASWKCMWVPPCLRPQAKDPRTPGVFRPHAELNGSFVQPEARVESLPDGQNDSDVSHLADRLAEIVDNSRFPSGRKTFQVVDRTLSLEEDGGWASKPFSQHQGGVDGIDNEEKIIDAIVALLRKSGDELQEKIQKDKTFCQRVWDMMASYTFFRRVTDRFLEEPPIDSTVNSEDQVKRIKVALIMEATTKLLVMDNHPMNLVLGFGAKYLQENFSPWIQSQGGWGKALRLPDQEEVE
ncbi:apoptosis facilitator Bcl-2-like protein 14 [Python bivittatus]|uniref:Apoptosis facilitator Bcl-2-like protein 14 n=1 Tax=Python bivittatus TaxID=176946 RepID=A0A9F2R430_PYTBI|nr:apoptosis facilitator Bcl-2-like protein 14 [Python bivittatus]